MLKEWSDYFELFGGLTLRSPLKSIVTAVNPTELQMPSKDRPKSLLRSDFQVHRL